METIRFGTYQQAKKWLKEKKDDNLMISKVESPPWSRVTALTKECGWVEINCTNTAIEMAYKYAEENTKEEVKLPEQFKDHAALFSNEEANKFPPS
jgi:hypothetical protein